MYKTKGLPNTRIEIADALRGIAVMGIIIFHCLENFNIFLDDKSMALPTDATVFSVRYCFQARCMEYLPCSLA